MGCNAGVKRESSQQGAFGATEKGMKMIVSGEGMVFSEFEESVYRIIQRRHLERVRPPVTVAAYDADAIPTCDPMPREISKISVSYWLHFELKARAGSGGVDRIAVDYCDGKGPRPRWFGIICDLDDSLSGQQAKLGPTP